MLKTVLKRKLLIATHNSAKFADLRCLLSDLSVEFVSLKDLGITHDVEEIGKTFEENALLKVSTYARLSGLPTISDDSGLMIDALNGEPGIYSARYAGKNATDFQKVLYLLSKMKDIPKEQRQATFVSTVAFAQPNCEPKVYRGELKGMITTEPRGILQPGYSYKVIFEVPTCGKTLAELVDKPQVSSSHRAQALSQFITDFQKVL